MNGSGANFNRKFNTGPHRPQNHRNARPKNPGPYQRNSSGPHQPPQDHKQFFNAPGTYQPSHFPGAHPPAPTFRLHHDYNRGPPCQAPYLPPSCFPNPQIWDYNNYAAPYCVGSSGPGSNYPMPNEFNQNWRVDYANNYALGRANEKIKRDKAISEKVKKAMELETKGINNLMEEINELRAKLEKTVESESRALEAASLKDKQMEELQKKHEEDKKLWEAERQQMTAKIEQWRNCYDNDTKNALNQIKNLDQEIKTKDVYIQRLLDGCGDSKGFARNNGYMLETSEKENPYSYNLPFKTPKLEILEENCQELTAPQAKKQRRNPKC